MKTAPNLVLVGPMGAGKSSIGRRLAGRFSLSFVDADREIEKRTGANVNTIFECEGEAGFRAREREVLADLLSRDALVIATGGGAVLDAGNRLRMRERGFVVHLHVSVEHQLARLARDRSRPLLATDDRETVLRNLTLARAPLYAEVADLRLDTDALSPPEACSRLGKQLSQHWTHGEPASPPTEPA